MKFSLIMESWRRYLKEYEGADKLDQGVGGTGGVEISEPEQWEDPGIDTDGVPNSLKRPPKHSIVIGNPKGKGTRSDPRGIFINGEFLGEDNRWILGKNSDNFYKFDRKYRKTDEPNPIYRQTHYGTTELIRTIKDAIDKVSSVEPEVYAARFAKMLLGNQDSTITEEEKKYGKALMDLGLYPKNTQPLYIEDLGLAPFFTDVYGNTYHGGRAVAGHGSHRTGEDADLGFYMLPGNEMTTMFPKNQIHNSKLEPRFRDDPENRNILKRIRNVKRDKETGEPLSKEEQDPLYRTRIQMGGLGPSLKKISRKNSPILQKSRLDQLVRASELGVDGLSREGKGEEAFNLSTAVGEIRNYLSGGKLVVRNTRVKDKKAGKLVSVPRAYLETTVGTIDMERTWVLVGALFESGLIVKCLIDQQLNQALRQACKRAGGTWPGSKLFHWPNHKNHIHINVNSKTSKALGKTLGAEISKAYKSWSGLKSMIKKSSKENPSWLDDFYDREGYSSRKPSWGDFLPDEWDWNKFMDQSGVFDELINIVKPGGLKQKAQNLSISDPSGVIEDALRKMEEYIKGTK